MSSGCFDHDLYNLFRKDCGPTLYDSNKTPVTVDVLEVGFLFAAAILAFSFLLIVPGFRGKEKWFFCLRVIVCLFVTTSIMLTNFGQEWEVSSLSTRTPYRAGLNEEIHAHIGVKISLRSINITLKGEPEVAVFKNGTHEERINYNERYRWNDLGFAQGRRGFGPYAGLLNREFRASQWRGTPLPILWIAEYFTLDGEGIRWGRHYRQAGWYTHILIWSAFPAWLLAMIMPYMVMLYAGYLSVITGLLLVTANILFATIRNINELSGAIPFEDGKLYFHFGWCFWLNLVTGLLCIVMGIIIIIMDLRFAENITSFFGVDILQDYEEYYMDAREIQAIIEQRQQNQESSTLSRIFTKKHQRGQNGVQMRHLNTNENGASGSGLNDLEEYEDVETATASSPTPSEVYQRAFRPRKDTIGNRFALPPPLPEKKVGVGAKGGASAKAAGRKARSPERQGEHHTARVGKQQKPVPPTSHKIAKDEPPKPSPKTKPKPKMGKTPPSKEQADAAPSPSSSTALLSSPSPSGAATTPRAGKQKPLPAPPKPASSSLPPTPPKKVKQRDDSGRSQEDVIVFSGSYDNNYEDPEAIMETAQGKGEAIGMSPLERLQAANARL